MKSIVARFLFAVFRQSFTFQTNFTWPDVPGGKVYTDAAMAVYTANGEEVYV